VTLAGTVDDQSRSAERSRRIDITSLLSGPVGELGFGGVAGAIVGYTAKKVTKLAALVLGAIFIVVQLLVYADIISVNWKTLQDTAQGVWTDPQGATLASRAWKVISGNLPFGGGFVAGFAVGFKLG